MATYRAWFASVWVVGFCLIASPAGATPNAATSLALAVPTPDQVACNVCHAGGVTGVGTATTPFGRATRALGLVPDDASSVLSVVMALRAARTDSDGDRVPDIEELEVGTDPNAVEGSTLPTLKYGCSISSASSSRVGGSSFATLGVILLLSWATCVSRSVHKGRRLSRARSACAV